MKVKVIGATEPRLVDFLGAAMEFEAKCPGCHYALDGFPVSLVTRAWGLGLIEVKTPCKQTPRHRIRLTAIGATVADAIC
jgi:hypothetical protein